MNDPRLACLSLGNLSIAAATISAMDGQMGKKGKMCRMNGLMPETIHVREILSVHWPF